MALPALAPAFVPLRPSALGGAPGTPRPPRPRRAPRGGRRAGAARRWAPLVGRRAVRAPLARGWTAAAAAAAATASAAASAAAAAALAARRLRGEAGGGGRSGAIARRLGRRSRVWRRAQDGGAERGGGGGGFSFTPELWGQFLRIAAPYFVPAQAGSRASAGSFGADNSGFLTLIFALLVGVVSGTFWLFLGAGTAASSLLPASALPDGLTGTLASMVGTPALPAAAGVGLTGAAAVFFGFRDRLDGRWSQWGLLGLLLFLLFGVTGLNVLLSYVFRVIDNVLVAKDAAAFYQQLGVFAAVLVVAVPVISAYRYVRLTLGRRWRNFLTVLVLDKYLEDRSFYLLDSNSQGTDVDNPDQRIAEDVEYFTRETLDFLLDLLDSVLNLFSFSAILWATSQQLTGALVVYALLGTYIALFVGARLIGINYEQLRLQADFRYSLVHIRDNAEAIAFYAGERRERREVVRKLEAALANYDQLITWTTGLSAYQQAFFYLARLVPYFVLGGLYFGGAVDFGTLGQAQFAFSMVLGSVTLIVTRIQDISRFSAGITRLGAFEEALAAAAGGAPGAGVGGRIATRVVAADAGVEARGLTLRTPSGARVLLERLDVALSSAAAGARTRLLVVGSSGVGKSSVLRAIAGLWTRGGGEVRRPPSSAMLFLPQKPYMPLGDLRTQLLYPSEGTLADGEDAWLREVLADFGLGDLPDRFAGGFDALEDWTRVLSLGEQQRLAAARCLTTGPRFVVLDEATSALPLPSERTVYERLAQEPHIEGYISVGHRASLAQFHDLVLEIQGGGAWRLMSPEEYTSSVAQA